MKFPKPKGGIWKNSPRLSQTTLRSRIRHAFHKKGVEINESEIDQIIEPSHTLAVKINDDGSGCQHLKAKYIAVQNTAKKSSNQPDYFIHLYQAHTGAAPLPPFAHKGATSEVQKESPLGHANHLRGEGAIHNTTTGLEIRIENVREDMASRGTPQITVGVSGTLPSVASEGDEEQKS